MNTDPHSVGDVLDELERLTEDADTVSIGDFLAGLGRRGYGPVLLVPALLEITPVGGIPGVPTFLAAIIITFAVQILIGHDHLWLPGFIERRRLSSGKLCEATAKLRGTARFLDRWFHGRLPALTRPPIPRIAAAIVILLACTVPPLELLPFASTAPMAAIAAFGLALLVRDGFLMAIAGILAMVALGVGFGLVGSEVA
ncbi:exopolysaccharide biosynthesis protein [Stakelama tenebrarum]|uniref:Exopolysaccharide biosynthesis protein n=1 Tax=Stakelama tenebrarum TaxID=2711215 RepID=A0A6G6Y376_9SPHN|nr:exopolysaccharide biosynthesis protein [Sphingosinithalassobacter tenebrarum]QIG79350.1 exopolysaccharide biosynthesis protein [Sphingosinithalassobacter tenebrarum]